MVPEVTAITVLAAVSLLRRPLISSRRLIPAPSSSVLLSAAFPNV
jgi:hypothetical protein